MSGTCMKFKKGYVSNSRATYMTLKEKAQNHTLRCPHMPLKLICCDLMYC